LGKDAVQELMRGDRAGVEMLVRNTQPHIAYGAVILLLIGAPLGEELFFRGLLVDLLRDRVGTIRAVFLGALLFALLHFYILQFVPVLISGVILGLLFVRSKNIFFPVIAHATVNTLALAALLMSL
jgi:membrane protease YdiL (CAAX protease family)